MRLFPVIDQHRRPTVTYAPDRPDRPDHGPDRPDHVCLCAGPGGHHWPAEQRCDSKPFIFHEVIDRNDGAVTVQQYYDIGNYFDRQPENSGYFVRWRMKKIETTNEFVFRFFHPTLRYISFFFCVEILLVRSFIIPSFIHSLIRSFVHSFVRSFVRSCIHSVIDSFVCSFFRSFSFVFSSHCYISRAHVVKHNKSHKLIP